MATLYGYTILADLAVLAILVGIFIFAASIYKGAFEFSAKEEQDALNRRKKLINTRKTELAEKMKGIDDNVFPKEIKKELDSLNTELKTIDQSISKSKNRARALTVRNMVAIPTSLLLISIVTSGIAIATSGITPTIMWSLALVLLAASLCFTYRNLRTVEFFSGILDLSTLMEQALDRHTQKMRPIVDLEI